MISYCLVGVFHPLLNNARFGREMANYSRPLDRYFGERFSTRSMRFRTGTVPFSGDAEDLNLKGETNPVTTI
jgi:hypothetical protein